MSATMTEDETSRLSNVCHLNREDDNNNEEAGNDNGARLDDNSPAAATAVSSAILRSSFLWLHSTANDNKDGYDEKWQRQSSPCCKSSKFTTMWTTVRTRILWRRTGGGGYHDGNKSD
jgi:hypothetical protein